MLLIILTKGWDNQQWEKRALPNRSLQITENLGNAWPLVITQAFASEY